jgi:hypothetical protein
VRKSLAEIVVEEGLIDEARLQAAEKQARRSGEPLIVTLVELERAADTALATALSRHLRLTIVEATEEAVEPEALREVAHELARRRRVLPLSIEVPAEGPRVLRMAMADPTDRDAIAEIEISTGCRVTPALATLTSVEKALAKAYRGFVTEVMPRSEIRRPFGAGISLSTPSSPAESETSARPGTQPFHRIEDEAPIELRHRALVELLQDKGLITAEEYLAEIRNLLKSRE